ncbi:MAG: sugar transferase [Calditrichaeota bacterium]|nr:MAG: sugar transferase [Calditrichota bacterium]
MSHLVIEKSLDIRTIADRESRRLLQQRRELGASLFWLEVRERLYSSLITALSILYTVLLPPAVARQLRTEVFRRYLSEFAIRMIDVAVALTGLILSLPLFLIVPVLIKLDSPGPVFYHQVRTGIDRRRGDRRNADLGIGKERRKAQRRQQDLFGKPFKIYKFRSMYENAEADSGPVWASEQDPRVTRVGRILRRFHIDEIPQFWNILKGDMSVVGPRPERPEIIRQIVDAVPEYRLRHRVRPGLTGLAQIWDGYDSSLDDVRKKLSHDLEYIRIRGPVTNISIILQTLVYLYKPQKFQQKTHQRV